MSNGEESSSGISGPTREGVEGVLCDYFASDSLSMSELERRLDRTHRASTLQELRSVLSDLPVGKERFEALAHGWSSSPTSASVREAHPAPASHAELRRLAESRNSNDLALAVFGGSSRRGRWLPAERTTALTVCGGVELDFREAVLPPGVTEIQVFALMGGIEIIVSPGTAVDAAGFALMGGFDHADESLDQDPDRPVLRIRGMVLMGAIEVSVRYPGESARDAKKRKKRERRERRRSEDRTLGRGS
ncbi:MAG: LiaF-related protein [Longimicrobiales bacterium]|nr:LiaF-related protein [Longimicrobiales bacterium]